MKLAICLFLLSVGVVQILGHGRIVNPPARNTLWRYPEYAHANPIKIPDDQELLCGGTGVTDPFVGACGMCGDSISAAVPRAHEVGGSNERGVIVRSYSAGQTIPVEIFLAVDHRGWFEYRICDYSRTRSETEECFNEHLLRFSDGKTRYDNWAGQNLVMNVVLPAGLRCERCILQWTWYGEGSAQWYRNCADITIN